MKRIERTFAGRSGFTLLEVLIALGILATSYVALIQTFSGSMRLSTYGRQVTVASFLAQDKLEEAEEKLLKDGLPVDSEESHGTFDNAGYPDYRWKLEVRKVELPVADAFNFLLNRAEGEDGKKSGMPGQGLGSLGGALGQGGGAGALGANALSTDMLKGYLDMFSQQLDQMLREARLVVEWGEGGPGKQVIVTTHFVQLPQASGAAGLLQQAASSGELQKVISNSAGSGQQLAQ